ncbi:hypothetical protein Tco_0115650 [Tanacetum coccineum]
MVESVVHLFVRAEVGEAQILGPEIIQESTENIILIKQGCKARDRQSGYADLSLHFGEEPFEIVGREVKRLKRSRIPLVKVRWNSKRGPEFTWEREDQFKKKITHTLHKERTVVKCCIVKPEDIGCYKGEVYIHPVLLSSLETSIKYIDF